MGVLLYSSIYSLCKVSFDEIASSGIDHNYPLSGLLINCVLLGHNNIWEIFGGAERLARPLTIYDTTRPSGKFANENAMGLIGQVRQSWPFMLPLGHVKLAKTLWHF